MLRGLSEFGSPAAVSHSGFLATVDDEACIGCEACVNRCKFGALALDGGIMTVDDARCVGCGLCASVCPVDALSLVRRVDAPEPPANVTAWRKVRNKARGL